LLKLFVFHVLSLVERVIFAYHSLNQPEQVILVRLRLGHNRLTAHIYTKNRLVQSPKCPCGEDQTAEHVLLRCKRHDQERAVTWPQETTLQQKLYGDVKDLRQTTSFIGAALKCAPIMEWEFILASGRSSF